MPPTGSPRPDLSWVRPGVGAVAVHSYEHVLKPAGKPSKRKFLSFAAGDAFTIVKKGKDVSEPATASFAVDVCFIDSYIEYNINASETGVIFYPFFNRLFCCRCDTSPGTLLSHSTASVCVYWCSHHLTKHHRTRHRDTTCHAGLVACERSKHRRDGLCPRQLLSSNTRPSPRRRGARPHRITSHSHRRGGVAAVPVVPWQSNTRTERATAVWS